MRRPTLMFVLAGLFLPIAAAADLDTPHHESSRTDEDEFLRPYINELKTETSAGVLEQIRNLPKEALFLLHHEYGLWMRNFWLGKKRNRKLIRFLAAKGAKYADDESQMVIEALWLDLDRGLSPQQRIAVEEHRTLTTRRLKLYQTLSAQCIDLAVKHKAELERCYSADTTNQSEPPRVSFIFDVTQTGKVGEVSRLPPQVTECVKAVVDPFTFSSYDTDTSLHLWLMDFSHCRVKEINRLYE